MVDQIGYAPMIRNTTRLAEQYSGLVLDAQSHFSNVLHARIWNRKRRLLEAWSASSINAAAAGRAETEYMVHPQSTDIQYHFGSNVLYLPAASLQSPYFGTHVPEPMNFGSLGSVVARELVHAIDGHGRWYTKDGQHRLWWSRATAQAFQNRTQCLVQQFDGYRLFDDDENDNNHDDKNNDGVESKRLLSGKTTLLENVADLGGLQLAYQAWKDADGGDRGPPSASSRRHRHAKEYIGLSDRYTPDQLFFLGFAQTQCARVDPAVELHRWMVGSPRAPHRLRVNAALANTKEFAEAFRCTLGQPMYPKEDRCQVW